VRITTAETATERRSGAFQALRRGVDAVERFWEPPDELLLDAGKSAELVIARIRLALTGLLLLIPIQNLMVAPPEERAQHVTGFWITLVAVVISILVYLLVRRDKRQPWLPVVTSVTDVTLVSFALIVFAFIGDPHQVVNSKITFETYFLALGATCLRYDARVAMTAGVLAIVQYMATVVFVWSNFPLDLVGGVSPYGRFQWSDQISRVILLGTATALNVTIVRGLQRQRILSSSDPLTGLFNRRFFDTYLASEVQRAERYRTPFTVAMIDVDYFKRFNDSFGHAAGDDALRTVSRVLQHTVRQSDLIARYGGEELVALFRETEAEPAVERVEEIRQAVAVTPITIDRDKGLTAKVTVSAGVASWPADGLTPRELLVAADLRLFKAKANGRNQVVGPPGSVRVELGAQPGSSHNGH
jgi:diguanylate cyclase (GGDEF)-like protein